MIRSLGWRLASALALLVGLSVFGFALLVLLPGDYAEVVLVHQMDGDIPSPDALAAFKADNALDRPLPAQYLAWLARAAGGDLGTSFATGDPVLEEVALRLEATFRLVGLAFALTLLLGLPLGVVAAVRRGSRLDRVVMAGAVLGMSVPNFWQALLFVLLFSLALGWLPSSGYGGLSHAILPALVIATAHGADGALCARQPHRRAGGAACAHRARQGPVAAVGGARPRTAGGAARYR
ncbi:MAG: hypothetical protein AcusKO_37470 [Acuticoccus sp.]